MVTRADFAAALVEAAERMAEAELEADDSPHVAEAVARFRSGVEALAAAVVEGRELAQARASRPGGPRAEGGKPS